MPEPDNSKYIQEGNDLAAMASTPGWAIVRKYVGQQLNAHYQLLGMEKDYNKILDLQAKIAALRCIVEDTENHIFLARKAAQEQAESEGPATQA